MEKHERWGALSAKGNKKEDVSGWAHPQILHKSSYQIK